jgi:TRAP-type mannitol/chloroaromatic compound transport system substrate-binding protein
VTAAGGRLAIDYFPGGAVVPAAEEASALRTGSLDYCYTAGQYNQNLNIAFGFTDSRSGGLTDPQMQYWLRAEGNNLVGAEYAKYGIVWVSVHQWSPEDFAYTDFPLKTLDDVKKLKMRTAGVGGEILQSMGASTIFLPGGELYESMQRGVINAFEYGSASNFWDMGFQEVTKYLYLSLSRAPSDGGCWLASQKSWNALPDDLKMIVMEIQRGNIDQYWVKLLVDNGVAMQKIKDYGVVVEKLSKEIEDAFMAAAAKYFDKKIAEQGADSFYAKMVNSQSAFKKMCEAQGVY